LTPQEEQLLNSLVERINQKPLEEKDLDADVLLNQKLSPNPYALYILAQTVLVQNIALDQAKSQIAQLQHQVQQLQQHPQPAHTTSFLGRLLGEHDDAAPAQQRAPSPPPYQPVPQFAPPAQPYQQFGQPPYQQTQYVPVGGQPSFLRGAMQTAAGVAAGALAFEGVESILHGFGHGGYGFGGPGYGMGGFGMGERPVEVINNYYDEPGRGGEHHMQDDPNDSLRGFDQNAGSTSDQDTRAFSDASNLDDPAAFDDQNVDDQNLDNQSANGDSGFDDSGSFDDGGGLDSGSDGF
jgi:uncharacterized protein